MPKIRNVEFYEELNENGESQGNCIAIFSNAPPYRGEYGMTREGLAAVFFRRNSDTNITGIPVQHLETQCRKVDEARAREIHPRLVERLELAPDDYWGALQEESDRMWGKL